MRNAITLAAAALAAAIALFAGEAAAQAGGNYPARPVKLVVTLAPGGSNDVIARLFAQKLSEQLKQSFVVENRPGGNMIPGAAYVAKSAPDGYTLLVGNTSLLTILVSLYSKLPFDPQRDFAPVSLLVIGPTVLVVRSSLPAQDVKELIALAKAQPGKLNYATPGNGTPFHLSTELFKTQTGTDILHVPYKGNAPAIADLVAGRVDLMFGNVLEVLPSIRSGRARPLAVTGHTRVALLPDVPTMAEAGIRNAESHSFFAIVAPAGTPREIVNLLHAEFAKAQADSNVQQRLKELGVESGKLSPDDLEAYIRAETTKWAKVVKSSGAKVE